MKKILALGIILLIVTGCQQESKSGVVGQQFILKADIPNEVGSLDYIWKITDLPENSELMLSDIQFSEDESQAIFTPDVAGQFSIQVTVWKYNDKLGAFVYNYNITEATPELIAQQQSRDEWLNETIDKEPIVEAENQQINEEDLEKPIEKVENIDTKTKPMVVEKPKSITTAPVNISEANFTIQVAAESNSEAAIKLVKRFTNAGMDAYIQEINTESNQTLYRVRVGKFATKEDATPIAEKIENDFGLSPWITKY